MKNACFLFNAIVVLDIDLIARNNEYAIRIKMTYVHFHFVLHAYTIIIVIIVSAVIVIITIIILNTTLILNYYSEFADYVKKTSVK